MNKITIKLIRSFLLLFPSTYNLIFDLKHRYFLNFFLKKVHENDFNAFELISEEDSQLFLDVGANAGQSALSIFLIKPNARVISFEPNYLNYIYLERLEKQFDNFEYYKFGLGDENKSIDFFCPIYNGKKMTPWGSFDYEEATKGISKEIQFFDQKKLSVETMALEIKTLDSLDLEPDFIKIDVQGFEYQVLLGGKETIMRCKPIFMIESVIPDGDVHNFLRDFGYFVYQFRDGMFFQNEFNSLNQFLFPKEKLYLIQDLVAAKV